MAEKMTNKTKGRPAENKSNTIRSALFLFVMICFGAFLLASCDLSTPTVSGDNSVIPSNFKRVSYNDLPGWRDDDVRYALQAFRNSCKAKIQFTGRLIPDKELFAEKFTEFLADKLGVKGIEPKIIFEEMEGCHGFFDWNRRN